MQYGRRRTSGGDGELEGDLFSDLLRMLSIECGMGGFAVCPLGTGLAITVLVPASTGEGYGDIPNGLSSM